MPLQYMARCRCCRRQPCLAMPTVNNMRCHRSIWQVQVLQAAPMLDVANGLTACEATMEYHKVRVLHAAGLLRGSWRKRQHGSCDGHCTRPFSFLLHTDRGPPIPYTWNWAIAGLQSEKSLAGEQCQCARPVALFARLQISPMGVLLTNTSVSVKQQVSHHF